MMVVDLDPLRPLLPFDRLSRDNVVVAAEPR